MSSAYSNIAIKAAYQAGNFIQKGSRNLSSLKIEKKGHNDFVTELDKKSEEIIKKIIHQAYPEHNILGEESGYQNGNSEYTWIIDPIDGTTNFMHGYPHYSISIALKQHDKITHGIIFDPSRNDLYQTELGKGAFLNDKRLRVSANSLEYALVATGFPTCNMDIMDEYLAIFKEITLKTSGHRRAGSAALDLAYVASGIIDGFWEYDLKTWDVAAGVLMVKEAGGIVTTFDGGNHDGGNGTIIAANPKIINLLQKAIQIHYKKS